jgi:hypothetical protein
VVGEAIERPQRLVRGLLGHRKQREGQIRRLLAAGTGAIISAGYTARWPCASTRGCWSSPTTSTWPTSCARHPLSKW